MTRIVLKSSPLISVVVDPTRMAVGLVSVIPQSFSACFAASSTFARVSGVTAWGPSYVKSRIVSTSPTAQ